MRSRAGALEQGIFPPTERRVYGTPVASPTGILAMAAWLSLIALRDFSSLCETFFTRSEAPASERIGPKAPASPASQLRHSQGGSLVGSAF